MTIHKALHPRDDIYRLYMSRKEGGRGHASIEDCINVSTKGFEEHKERLMQPVTAILIDCSWCVWNGPQKPGKKRQEKLGIRERIKTTA